jgi:hypothetical protein
MSDELSDFLNTLGDEPLPPIPVQTMPTDDVAVVTPEGRVWVDIETWITAQHAICHMLGEDHPLFEGRHEQIGAEWATFEVARQQGETDLLSSIFALPDAEGHDAPSIDPED